MPMRRAHLSEFKLSLTLKQIADAIRGEFTGDPQVRIQHISTDSRKSASGNLFVALQGEKFDGRNFLAAAVESGAPAILIDHWAPEINIPQIRVRNTTTALGDLAAAHRKSWRGPVIGVTGSVGKTTAREMIVAALGSLGVIHSSSKNYNNEIGVPQTLLELTDEHRVCVVEMGMRAMREIARLAEISSPDVGVITNIGMSHIERLGNQFNIARAKRELLEGLTHGSGAAILPRDDTHFSFLADYARDRGRVITFGKSAESDLRVSDIRLSDLGIATFDLNGVEVTMKAPGAHLPINAACACATAFSMGVSLEAAIQGLNSYQPPSMRLELVAGKSGAIIINDAYNAAPDSMLSALQTLNALAGTRRRSVAILGEMRELGDYSSECHRIVGGYAAEAGVDILVAIGPNVEPLSREFRQQSPESIIVEFKELKLAIPHIEQLIEPDDVVLVKGSRAMTMEQIVERLQI